MIGEDKMERKEQIPTKETIEKLTRDMIAFLRKWGLWEGVTIFADGEKLRLSAESDGVEATECADQTDFIYGICKEDAEHGSRPHFFFMTFDGPLYRLLNEQTYSVPRESVAPEAWEEVYMHSDELDGYIVDRCGVVNEDDFLAKVACGAFAGTDAAPLWDPAEFDTWEDYVSLTGKAAIAPKPYRTARTDSELVDGVLDFEGVRAIWDKMIGEAKKSVRESPFDLDSAELAEYLYSSFNELFENAGLSYDFITDRSLGCEL